MIAMALAGLLLGGCGGGGGSGGSASPFVTVWATQVEYRTMSFGAIQDISGYADGSFVVVGNFTGQVVLGAGEANEVTLTSADMVDSYVARYNANGTLAWATRLGAFGDDYAIAIAAAAGGACVVVGYFESTITLGGGEPNETTFLAKLRDDLFVARYNANGTLAWARQAGSDSNERALGVAAFADGSVVVTGQLGGGTVFGEGEPNETSLSSQGGAGNTFVARYNASGSLAWARRTVTTPDLSGPELIGTGIATIPDGTFVVAGHFQGNGIFGEGAPNETSLSSAGDYDVFVMKHGGDGSFLWARRAGGPLEDFVRDVAAFPDGSSVITGDFKDNAVFAPGVTLANGSQGDVFVARYQPDGGLAWARRGRGSTTERGFGVATLPDGSTVVVGDYYAATNFDLAGARPPSRPASDLDQVFVGLFDAAGRLSHFGAIVGEFTENASRVAAFSDMTFVVSGGFSIEAIFGLGTPEEIILTEAVGGSDVFLARYSVP
jgi:hypothetical protein